MTKRLVLLLLLLGLGFGSIFALPKSPGRQESAIRQQLPQYVGLDWTAGRPLLESEQERKILAADTQFFRRDYFRSPTYLRNPDGDVEVIQTSIVLSGKDMTQSIHRPERCLEAQGWNLDTGKNLPVTLRDGKKFSVRRILCETPRKTSTGEVVVLRMLNYYWFVGSDEITCSHYERSIQDIKDRILHGYDQRWAYVTMTVSLTPAPFLVSSFEEPSNLQLTEEESMQRLRRGRTMTPEEADGIVQEFIRDIAPEIIDVEKIKTWSNPS